MKNLLTISILALSLSLSAQNFENYSFSGGHTTAKKVTNFCIDFEFIIDVLEKNGSSKKLLPFESFLTSTKIVRCFRNLDFACINHS